MIRKTSALVLAAALLAAPVVAFAQTPPASPTSSITPGSTVYDPKGKEIGTVADILTSTHGAQYAVLDVSPYVGTHKMVLVPLDHITTGGEHMTMDATKRMVMHMGSIMYNMPSGGH